MKKLSLFTLLALIAVTAQAQTNISALAEVEATISVAATRNLDFGTFADGASSSQALTTGNEASLGLFTISGQTAGADVDFALNTPLVLTSLDSADDLPYAATASLSTSTDIDNDGTDYTLDGSGDGTEGVTGVSGSNYFVYVGGTVDASNGAEDYSGSYSGTITLTVDYQ